VIPQWHGEDDAGAIKVVMTGVAPAPAEWRKHIDKRPKARRELPCEARKKSRTTHYAS